MHAALSRARPAFELGLDACAFLLLPLLALASRGAAALEGVAGVLALGLAASAGTAAWRKVRWLALLFAAAVLWGLASSLWAIQPHRSLLIAARLTGLFAAGLALVAAAGHIAAPRRLAACLGAGLAVALVLTVLQFATGGELTDPFFVRPFKDPLLNQVENGFVLLLLPLAATLILRRRIALAVMLLVATVSVVGLLVGIAAKTALAAGLGAGILCYLRRRCFVRVAAVASIVLVLAAPVIFPPLIRAASGDQLVGHLEFSMYHRLEIWSFTGDRIAERPLLGWGLDSSRAIPGGSALIPGPLRQQYLPLHPHNMPLQAWLELGVPGAVLLALFVARLWLALGAAGWPRLFAAAAGASLAAVQTVSLGSYGIWQEWWIGTEFLSVFLILVMARLAAEPADSPIRAPLVRGA